MNDTSLSEPILVRSQVDDLPGFYDKWRKKVYDWIGGYTRGEVADAVLLLPDMVALLIRLVMSPRTPLYFKTQLFLVLTYVLSPIDFIPEGVFGAAGLADDALLVSAMLLKLVQSATTLDPQLVRDLWPGQGDIMQIVQETAQHQGNLMDSKVLRSLMGLVGISIPEPAIVETPSDEA